MKQDIKNFSSKDKKFIEYKLKVKLNMDSYCFDVMIYKQSLLSCNSN